MDIRPHWDASRIHSSPSKPHGTPEVESLQDARGEDPCASGDQEWPVPGAPRKQRKVGNGEAVEGFLLYEDRPHCLHRLIVAEDPGWNLRCEGGVLAQMNCPMEEHMYCFPQSST